MSLEFGADEVNNGSTRTLLMDAYNSCALTAETLGAPEVAVKIRELAFQIRGEIKGPGKTTWILPALVPKP